MGHSGAGEKLIHKKTRSKKSCDTVPLRRRILYLFQTAKSLLNVHGKKLHGENFFPHL